MFRNYSTPLDDNNSHYNRDNNNNNNNNNSNDNVYRDDTSDFAYHIYSPSENASSGVNIHDVYLSTTNPSTNDVKHNNLASRGDNKNSNNNHHNHNHIDNNNNNAADDNASHDSNDRESTAADTPKNVEKHNNNHNNNHNNSKSNGNGNNATTTTTTTTSHHHHPIRWSLAMTVAGFICVALAAAGLALFAPMPYLSLPLPWPAGTRPYTLKHALGACLLCAAAAPGVFLLQTGLGALLVMGGDRIAARAVEFAAAVPPTVGASASAADVESGEGNVIDPLADDDNDNHNNNNSDGNNIDNDDMDFVAKVDGAAAISSRPNAPHCEHFYEADAAATAAAALSVFDSDDAPHDHNNGVPSPHAYMNGAGEITESYRNDNNDNNKAGVKDSVVAGVLEEDDEGEGGEGGGDSGSEGGNDPRAMGITTTAAVAALESPSSSDAARNGTGASSHFIINSNSNINSREEKEAAAAAATASPHSSFAAAAASRTSHNHHHHRESTSPADIAVPAGNHGNNENNNNKNNNNHRSHNSRHNDDDGDDDDNDTAQYADARDALFVFARQRRRLWLLFCFYGFIAATFLAVPTALLALWGRDPLFRCGIIFCVNPEKYGTPPTRRRGDAMLATVPYMACAWLWPMAVLMFARLYGECRRHAWLALGHFEQYHRSCHDHHHHRVSKDAAPRKYKKGGDGRTNAAALDASRMPSQGAVNAELRGQEGEEREEAEEVFAEVAVSDSNIRPPCRRHHSGGGGGCGREFSNPVSPTTSADSAAAAAAGAPDSVFTDAAAAAGYANLDNAASAAAVGTIQQQKEGEASHTHSNSSKNKKYKQAKTPTSAFSSLQPLAPLSTASRSLRVTGAIVVIVLFAFFSFYIQCSSHFGASGISRNAAAPTRTAEYPWAVFKTTHIHFTEHLYLKLFPGNLFYFSFLALTVLATAAAAQFPVVGRFFGRCLFPRRAPGWSVGWVVFLLGMALMLALFSFYWIHDHNYKGMYRDHVPGSRATTTTTTTTSTLVPSQPPQETIPWNANYMYTSEIVARFFGQLATMIMSLLLFPTSRHSLLHRALGTNWDRLLWLHRVLGYAMLAAAAAHITAFVVNFYQEGALRRNLTSIPLVLGRRGVRSNFTIIPMAFATGILFVSMGFLALHYVRRRWFEVFRFAHLFAVYTMLPLLLWHCACGWQYLLPPLALWAVDRLVWLQHAGRPARVVSARVLAPGDADGSAVELVFEVAWAAAPGHYVLLQVPQLSLLEWHPFTLCEPPSPVPAMSSLSSSPASSPAPSSSTSCPFSSARVAPGSQPASSSRGCDTDVANGSQHYHHHTHNHRRHHPFWHGRGEAQKEGGSLPFSPSSSLSSPFSSSVYRYRVIIKSMGGENTWTSRLARLVASGEGPTHIAVEGPCGEAEEAAVVSGDNTLLNGSKRGVIIRGGAVARIWSRIFNKNNDDNNTNNHASGTSHGGRRHGRRNNNNKGAQQHTHASGGGLLSTRSVCLIAGGIGITPALAAFGGFAALARAARIGESGGGTTDDNHHHHHRRVHARDSHEEVEEVMEEPYPRHARGSSNNNNGGVSLTDRQEEEEQQRQQQQQQRGEEEERGVCGCCRRRRQRVHLVWCCRSGALVAEVLPDLLTMLRDINDTPAAVGAGAEADNNGGSRHDNNTHSSNNNNNMRASANGGLCHYHHHHNSNNSILRQASLTIYLTRHTDAAARELLQPIVDAVMGGAPAGRRLSPSPPSSSSSLRTRNGIHTEVNRTLRNGDGGETDENMEREREREDHDSNNNNNNNINDNAREEREEESNNNSNNNNENDDAVVAAYENPNEWCHVTLRGGRPGKLHEEMRRATRFNKKNNNNEFGVEEEDDDDDEAGHHYYSSSSPSTSSFALCRFCCCCRRREETAKQQEEGENSRARAVMVCGPDPLVKDATAAAADLHFHVHKHEFLW